MNKKICKQIIENKERFVPYLFTAKQVQIMEKYLDNAPLTRAEKTYLYSAIKKKTDALTALKEEYCIKGEGMIKERVKQAKEILKEINKEKAFISGTFLYAEKFNDIDIYIMSNRRKQYHKGKKHFICITESDLKKPLFISASKCSVSNFFIEEQKPVIGRPATDDLIIAYELAINEILDNDDQKTVRDLLFEYQLQIKNIVLDSFSLYEKAKEIIKKKKQEKIEIVNNMAKEMLLKMYSKRYMYDELTQFLKILKEDVKELKTHDNILIYIDLLGEVKDECRRAQT